MDPKDRYGSVKEMQYAINRGKQKPFSTLLGQTWKKLAGAGAGVRSGATGAGSAIRRTTVQAAQAIRQQASRLHKSAMQIGAQGGKGIAAAGAGLSSVAQNTSSWVRHRTPQQLVLAFGLGGAILLLLFFKLYDFPEPPPPPEIHYIEPTHIFIGSLPAPLTVRGENLSDTKQASLLSDDAENVSITLEVDSVQTDILTLTILALPETQEGAVLYTLQLDDQVFDTATITVSDVLRTATVRGVEPEYAYTPFIMYSTETDWPAQTMLLSAPDVDATERAPVRNGDMVEILDEQNDDWYQVRIRDESDPQRDGKTGWILSWLVNDEQVPSPPTACKNIPPNENGTISPSQCFVDGVGKRFRMNEFDPEEQITFRIFDTFDSTSTNISQEVNANSSGSYRFTFDKDFPPPGQWRYEFEGLQSGHKAVIYFVVLPAS
jgi:hypothetical protein